MAVGYNGTIASISDFLEADIIGAETSAVSISGTFNATLIVELSMDQAAPFFHGVRLLRMSNGKIESEIKNTGLFSVICAGTQKLKVRPTSFVSGSISVSIRAV